jgi:hypothetical protein
MGYVTLVMGAALCLFGGFALSDGALEASDQLSNEVVHVAGAALRLGEQDGMCTVQREGQNSLTTDLRAPCVFYSKQGDGTPRSRFYQGIGRVVLVVENPRERVCGDAAQAIIIEGSRIRLGGVDTTEGSYCRGDFIDEKLFYGLSH